MPFFDQPYTLLLLVAVGISAALAIAVLRNRPNLGNHAFAVLMVSVGIWAFLTMFEVASFDHPTKIFSGNLKYLFIAVIPVAWFTFSLYYANRIRGLKTSRLLMLSVVPALTVLMVATNNLHHLMFRQVEWFQSDSFYLISRKFGPWFWIHTAYSYILLFLGFIFIAKSLMDAQRIYRSQVISLMVAATAPWACNVLFLSGAQPFPKLDLTPFAFSISGLAVMWGILRYRLLDIVPIARDIVIQNMSDGIIVMDPDHRILDLNRSAARLAGVQQNSVIGRSADQVISWWPRLPVIGHLNDAGLPTIIEIENSGSYQFLQVKASVLRNNDKLTGHLVILRDVTEAMAAQEALRQSEERFKSLSENAPMIVVTLDDVGAISYANPAWESILGHTKEAVMGRRFTDFVVEKQHARCTDIHQQLINGKKSVAACNLEMVSQTGNQRIFDFTASVNSNEEGRITGIIGMAKDITEENQLQEQLLQSQKMEAIGTLAGGIAHDFNNLLMGMQANVSLLRLDPGNDDAYREKLQRIEDQIQSGSSLTRQLLGYARRSHSIFGPLDLHQLIDDSLNVVERTNKNIRIHRQLNASPAVLNADQGQMEVVLLNLFVNAVDAMPNSGELTVSTHRPLEEELAEHWSDVDPGPYIEIEVADTGTGMDEGTIKRIFEPFFTTKEIGRGTGLGLASVYGVVKNHHGHIRVSSRIGKGATFRLLLPAANGAMPEPVRGKTPTLIEAEGKRVLVVDDEAPILEYIGELVQSLGFKATLADNGLDAVRIYEAQSETIDLVILDMIMPEMDGHEVFKALHAIDPDLRVIIASGSELDERSKRIVLNGPHFFLKKPFTLDELASAFASILGAAPNVY